MTYGYARCSTNETKQDINRQVRELKTAGADTLFLEYEHGDSKIKSQQEAMFAQAQAGDTILTLEVPRLARSTQQLCEIIDRVREKRLRLVIIGSITLDCREGRADPMSEAFLQMAGGIQPVGIVDDTGACAVWYGERQGQGQADRQTADNRRQHSRNLPSPLSRFQKRAVEYFRIGKDMRFE